MVSKKGWQPCQLNSLSFDFYIPHQVSLSQLFRQSAVSVLIFYIVIYQRCVILEFIKMFDFQVLFKTETLKHAMRFTTVT